MALLLLSAISRGDVIGPNAGYPLIAAYSSEEIGCQVAMFSAVQDMSGVMHIGADGLFSYDGERWKKSPAPGVERIYALDLGVDDRLWAAGDGMVGWFERLPSSEWKFHQLPAIDESILKGGPIVHIYASGNGAVFSSYEHVHRWDGASLSSWKMPGSRRLNLLRIGGRIYIHYRLQGLFVLGESGPELVVAQDNIGAPDVALLWADSLPEGFLFATSNGVVRYENGIAKPYAPEVSRLLRDHKVTTGVRLRDGRVAFGTLTGGIVLMNEDGTPGGVLNESDGLPSPNIKSLTVDDDGGLWVTSLSHTFRLDPDGPSRVFDERSRLAPRLHYSIARGRNILAVANAGGVFAFNVEQRGFEPLNGVDASVHTLVAHEGEVVVCGYRGAWRIRSDGTASLFRKSDYDVLGALSSRVHPGELLFAEYPRSSVVVRAADGTERTLVSHVNGAVLGMAEDNRGRLWIATERNGVFLADRNAASAAEAHPVPSHFGLPPLLTYPRVIATADDDILVIADSGAWLKPADSDKFQAVEDHPLRQLADVSQFAGDNSAWVLYSNTDAVAASVARIVVANGRARMVPYSVPGLNTIGNPRSLAVETDADGRAILWIAGSRSVLRHAVQRRPVISAPQPPILRAFARHRSGDLRQPIVGPLPYSTRAIEFEFAAPEFSRRPSLRLHTLIDGFDRDWLPAGQDSRRVLTAIRDGKYTFRVRAVAETGVASEPTVFSFEVSPPWWRTTPAIVLTVAALLPLIFAGYQYRVRALHRRNVLLEEKVRERTEELAEASAAKTMFVANMSHDIRNPLNGIVGLTLALEDSRLDSRQRDLVATLRECTTYLSSLVDDVLDFASIEAGRVELRAGPYVPAELLNSVVTTLKAQAAERDAFITIETDPDLPPVLRADAGRIQQILVNYLSNAIKYAGGHIRLAVTLAPGSPGELEFSVADEGAGISPEEQATLFTKFTRLKSARRDHIQGTGLGLAACRLLADLMGGSVGVESQPGRGARFYLRLPLAVATGPVPVPSNVALPRATVLLVEDTDYNAVATTAVLARLGLTCDRARNGGEAVQLFAAKRHNIVLLDRNLPDMDGTEVAQRLRDLESDGLHSVILAVTAYCTPEDRALCLKAGMDAFVGKPLTPEKLRKILVDAGRRLVASSDIDAAADSVAQPDLNTSLLEYLAEGKEGGVSAEAERFVAALIQSHEELLAVRGSGDAAALADAAHSVLGHARMVGATRLTEAAIQLESAARAADSHLIEAALPLVARETAAVTATLRRRHAVQKA